MLLIWLSCSAIGDRAGEQNGRGRCSVEQADCLAKWVVWEAVGTRPRMFTVGQAREGVPPVVPIRMSFAGTAKVRPGRVGFTPVYYRFSFLIPQ